MAHISDIKLIRTDTTLDLSQKAEKGMLFLIIGLCLYRQFHLICILHSTNVGLRYLCVFFFQLKIIK
ncbi:hypothetical protein Hanom_Chr03g00246731 [Helianthus anomalus]